MWKRLAAGLTCMLMMLCACSAQADLTWPENPTPGQQALMAYIDRVNENLTQLGAAPVNQVFECYSGFASVGVTASPESDVPENVELVITMSDYGLQKLILRVSALDQFAGLAASCIQAARIGQIELADALKDPSAYVSRVAKEPANSFEDDVQEQQGDAVRTYYRYAPNEYNDGHDWLTMTLIFPWSSDYSSGVVVTPTPAPAIDYGNEYEGSRFDDDYTHLEVFATDPPSPDDGFIGSR